MIFVKTDLPDVLLIENQIHMDSRGEFVETYRKSFFSSSGLEIEFLQTNRVISKSGVLRGLHYQVEKPQGKLIQVNFGKIFDVAVDLRKSSQYFGKFVGVELSSETKKQLWIPEGFAHGYLVLSDWSDVSYSVTNYYNPELERILQWNDPDLNITWPVNNGLQPLLSLNDQNGNPLNRAEVYE